MRGLWLMCAALVVSGCAGMMGGIDSSQIPAREQALAMRDKAVPCCTAPQQLQYTVIDPKFNDLVLIDGSKQLVDFKSGRSFVEAWRLPANRAGYGIVIDSLIRNEEIFSPALLLLDAQFNAVQYVAPDQFVYVAAKGMSEDRLHYTLNIPPELGAEYLVILTTDEALAGSTEYIHPARAYALAQNMADPRVANPRAKHSPTGLLDIKIEGTFVTPVTAQKDVVERWVGSLWGDDKTAAPAVTVVSAEQAARAVPDSSSPVIAPAAATAVAVTASPGSMLAETEAMYNSLISKAVAAREIDKALKLVEEAERAGSASARTLFVEQVKALK